MLLEHLHKQLLPLDCTQSVWIAYSGGLDSHVLLNAMQRLRQQIPNLSIQAIHVHHGLSRHADSWREHCQAVCAALKVTLYCEHINSTPLPGESVEAWAREARYNIFAKILPANAVLLTAHTQDDQAETLLLQLLRGAGPKGLAAMPQRQVFSSGYLNRPLLDLTKQQLREYAIQQNLSWIEDESNADQRFDRNFLRHRIMPALRERWPAASKNIARSANHCAEAATALMELAQQDFRQILQVPESEPVLSIITLRRLSPSRQRNALRYWLKSLGCQLPTTQHIQQIQQDLINGRTDSQAQVSWGSWTIRRFQEALWLTTPVSSINITQEIPWDLSAPLELPGELGQLIAVKQKQGSLSLAIDPSRLSIRFRRGGERCRPATKVHTYPLKKLFQEWNVPFWERSMVPLLYQDDELAAVIGHCTCAPFAASAHEIGWSIQFISRMQ